MAPFARRPNRHLFRNSVLTLPRWTRSHGGQKYNLEQAANEFAGRLLVPVERLQQLYDEFAVQFNAKLPHWRSYEGVRSAFADSVAPKFGVNAQVIEVRLYRDGIWLAT